MQMQLSEMTKVMTSHLTSAAAVNFDKGLAVRGDLVQNQDVDEQQLSKVVSAERIMHLGSQLLDVQSQVHQELQAMLAVMGPLSRAVLDVVAAAPPLPAAAGSAVLMSRAGWVAGLKGALVDVWESLSALTTLLGPATT